MTMNIEKNTRKSEFGNAIEFRSSLKIIRKRFNIQNGKKSHF